MPTSLPFARLGCRRGLTLPKYSCDSSCSEALVNDQIRFPPCPTAGSHGFRRYLRASTTSYACQSTRGGLTAVRQHARLWHHPSLLTRGIITSARLSRPSRPAVDCIIYSRLWFRWSCSAAKSAKHILCTHVNRVLVHC